MSSIGSAFVCCVPFTSSGSRSPFACAILRKRCLREVDPHIFSEVSAYDVNDHDACMLGLT